MKRYALILLALASRDWRPMHHDREFAISRVTSSTFAVKVAPLP